MEKEEESLKTSTKELKSNTENYAGFWIRLLAIIIDGIIVNIVISPVAAILFPSEHQQEIYDSAYRTTSSDSLRSLVFIVYSVLMLYYYGATLGKMVMKVKVVNEEMKQPTITTIIIRETIGKFLSAIAIGIGYIWVAFDSKKQGWHDKIAKTYVVYSKK